MPSTTRDRDGDLDERRPFVDVAQAKGLSLSFARPTSDAPDLWRLDMDLVRVSIESAIVRARRQGIAPLIHRLERLLHTGTDVQQVDFVLGDRRTYYFPEDIETMVQSGPRAAHPHTVYSLCWLRCKPLVDGSQHVEEHEKRIGLIDNPNGSPAT
jgi:hypothetical protein